MVPTTKKESRRIRPRIVDPTRTNGSKNKQGHRKNKSKNSGPNANETMTDPEEILVADGEVYTHPSRAPLIGSAVIVHHQGSREFHTISVVISGE